MARLAPSPCSPCSPGPARVAVLGATGCVGRHLCAAFTAQGSDVIAIARRYAPRVAAHRFLPLDVAGSTRDELARALKRENADVAVNTTLGWGEELHHINVQLVERLLDALAALPESSFGSLAVKLRAVDPAVGIELTLAEAGCDYVDVREAVDAVVKAARVTSADPVELLGRRPRYALGKPCGRCGRRSPRTSRCRADGPPRGEGFAWSC